MEFEPIINLFRQMFGESFGFIQDDRLFKLSANNFRFKFLVPDKITWSLKAENHKIKQSLSFDGTEHALFGFFTTLIRFAQNIDRYEQFCFESFSKIDLPINFKDFFISSLREGVFRKKFVLFENAMSQNWINKSRDTWMILFSELEDGDVFLEIQKPEVEKSNVKPAWTGYASDQFFSFYGWLVASDPDLAPLILKKPDSSKESLSRFLERTSLEEEEEPEKPRGKFFLPGEIPDGPILSTPRAYHEDHMKKFGAIKRVASRLFGPERNDIEGFIWMCERKISNMIKYGSYERPLRPFLEFQVVAIQDLSKEKGFYVSLPESMTPETSNKFSLLFEIFEEARYHIVQSGNTANVYWF